jgi:hypothetical protein
MAQRPTHRVRIWRDPEDARWWLARLLDEGPVTQGRTLAEAREMACDMMRDAVDVLEISHQRVAQLVRDTR